MVSLMNYIALTNNPVADLGGGSNGSMEPPFCMASVMIAEGLLLLLLLFWLWKPVL